MPHDLTERSVAYTREFVHRFWNGDADGMAAMLADGFTWVGTQEEQFCFDAALFASAVAAINEAMPRAILMEETYRPLFCGEGTYVVAGQYLGYTSPGLSMVSAARQRLTMVWREVDDDLKLAHWHMSNPLSPARGNAAPPAAGTQETCRYVALEGDRSNYRTTSSIRDVGGTVHMLRLLDVVHLEASKQSTIVHCLSHAFRVRGGIQELASTLMGPKGCGLVRTHRSFYVNALYVQEIGADELVLTGGARIPVAARRRSEVCAQIERARREA